MNDMTVNIEVIGCTQSDNETLCGQADCQCSCHYQPDLGKCIQIFWKWRKDLTNDDGKNRMAAVAVRYFLPCRKWRPRQPIQEY